MSTTDRSAVTLLDCTLRDGGYYTNWNFDSVLVEEYLAACAAAGVDVVELGYASLDDNDRGPYGRLPAGLTPNLRIALPTDHSLRFAVMVDAGSLLGESADGVGPRLAERLATGALPVELVRVAVHHARVAECAGLVESLRGAGFGVCLNLMQIDLATDEQVDEIIGQVAAMGPLEAVYVADSLGSMHAARVRSLVTRFRAGQGAPVGIHAHDNQGFALGNTLAAAEAGALWLDSTVLGMGRGAGNARTEQLLAALGEPAGRMRPLLETTARHFLALFEKHRWGANPLYAIAGMHGVHPSYVQQLEATADHSPDRRLRALWSLASEGAHSFSAEKLQRVLQHA
ncbi:MULTISPECIES: hypothetical protein [unclassified Streptomyces]|uniref:hypothetical protein n=1 Tax=unclassified Streptomyces TaxID=2593676 RepID=UPI000DC7B697|nr:MULTISPECIES: hypothetical protein [unclassified Streptomyces]AWZ06107.1 hypothetical protein DRB89_17425 [Streptomyces sp. ICC4]AWZ12798.1 hypothetical protein DRB96_11175 [Streptomyces sp. ICC1]